MTCPKEDVCPLYNTRGKDWCDTTGTECIFYNTWYNSKFSVVFIEAAHPEVMPEVKKKIDS